MNTIITHHSLHFKDSETGVHSNSIEGSWKHAKASMSQYCRKKKFSQGIWQNTCSVKNSVHLIYIDRYIIMLNKNNKCTNLFII